MEHLHSKIIQAVQQEPSHQKIESLRDGVWSKIRDSQELDDVGLLDFSLTPLFNGVGLVLLLVSCLALSQISFKANNQNDLFDLRYFSYQMLPKTDLIVATYEVKE